MIKTVFFDLDNVIFDEDLLYFKYYEILWMTLRKFNSQWTFERIIKQRENLVRKYGDLKPYLSIARKYLSEKDAREYRFRIQYFTKTNHKKYIRTVPGISYVIRNLNHAYNLAIIANQTEEDYDFLANFKLLLPFRIAAISSKLKYRKPQHEIFLWALEKAKTEPQEAVMIGDRWDLDILPARQLGMNTVWVQFDHKTKGIFPQSDREKLYFNSLDRVSDWSEEKIVPVAMLTAIARNVDEILIRIREFEEETVTPTTPHSEAKKKEQEIEPQKSLWGVFKEIMEDLSETPP